MSNMKPTRLDRADYSRSCYFATIPAGVSLSAALSGDYWVHVFKSINVFDLFELVAEDGAFDVVARVVAKAPGMIKFRVISGIELAEPIPVGESKEGRFYGKHKGRGQYGVMDRTTGVWVADGLDKESADIEADRLNSDRMAS